MILHKYVLEFAESRYKYIYNSQEPKKNYFFLLKLSFISHIMSGNIITIYEKHVNLASFYNISAKPYLFL
jgi:hypothetical protein